jgi:hypothetical protein
VVLVTHPPDLPACPRCGGGPAAPTPLGMVCRSCAATLGPATTGSTDGVHERPDANTRPAP